MPRRDGGRPGTRQCAAACAGRAARARREAEHAHPRAILVTGALRHCRLSAVRQRVDAPPASDVSRDAVATDVPHVSARIPAFNYNRGAAYWPCRDVMVGVPERGNVLRHALGGRHALADASSLGAHTARLGRRSRARLESRGPGGDTQPGPTFRFPHGAFLASRKCETGHARREFAGRR